MLSISNMHSAVGKINTGLFSQEILAEWKVNDISKLVSTSSFNF